jgi:hypothetical protein
MKASREARHGVARDTLGDFVNGSYSHLFLTPGMISESWRVERESPSFCSGFPLGAIKKIEISAIDLLLLNH